MSAVMFRSTLISLVLVLALRRTSGSLVHSPSNAVLQWQLIHPGLDLPDNAVDGGYFTTNGIYETHYVGRVSLIDNIIPGHVALYPFSPNWLIYWTLDGATDSDSSPNFEVAVADSSKVGWVPGAHGSVPANAVVTGIVSGGELLYSCRAYEEISHSSENARLCMGVGTLRPSAGVCAIEFYGQHLYPTYEVLSIEP